MLATVVSAKQITVKVGDICQAQGSPISSKKDCNIKEGTVIIFKCSKWWPEPVKIYKNGVKVAEWKGKNYTASYTWTAKKNARIKWSKFGRKNPYIYVSDSESSDPVVREPAENEEESDACKQLKANAQKEIDNLAYDESKSLSENKAAVDAILAKLDRDLADQRLKEARERMVELESSFDSYKANRKSYLDAVLDADASTTCKTIVSDAKARIESVSYASNKTFAENRDVIDAIVHNCEDDVADQVEAENREREAKYADEYNAYKIKRASDCEDLGKDGDNDACLNAIAKAKSDIMALTYRRAASLQSNKDDVDDIYSDLSSSLNRIRKAEADAVQLAANKLTFDSYRSAMVKAVEDMVNEDDDDSESKQLISNAMNDIKNMKYDEAKTLNQNKTAVEDVIAPLSTQLVSLRMKNAAKKLAANKAAFEDYKKSIRLVK
jgi:hypothetical protein